MESTDTPSTLRTFQLRSPVGLRPGVTNTACTLIHEPAAKIWSVKYRQAGKLS
jgi:hypothetical protein